MKTMNLFIAFVLAFAGTVLSSGQTFVNSFNSSAELNDWATYGHSEATVSGGNLNVPIKFEYLFDSIPQHGLERFSLVTGGWEVSTTVVLDAAKIAGANNYNWDANIAAVLGSKVLVLGISDTYGTTGNPVYRFGILGGAIQTSAATFAATDVLTIKADGTNYGFYANNTFLGGAAFTTSSDLHATRIYGTWSGTYDPAALPPPDYAIAFADVSASTFSGAALAAIPEPSAFAFGAGVVALGFLIIRNRRLAAL